MHSDNLTKKAGMTMVEVMISISIFGMLGAAVWSNVFLQGQSYLYNRISNGNIQEASHIIDRLVHGSSDTWGLRTASSSQTMVVATGVTGPTGSSGWQATVEHNVDIDDRPDILDTELLLITYHPVDRTIDVNGEVVGRSVEDAYLQVVGEEIRLGVLVVQEDDGLESIMETTIRMRNE